MGSRYKRFGRLRGRRTGPWTTCWSAKDVWICRRADAIWTVIINPRSLAISMLFREYALRISGKGVSLAVLGVTVAGLDLINFESWNCWSDPSTIIPSFGV